MSISLAKTLRSRIDSDALPQVYMYRDRRTIAAWCSYSDDILSASPPVFSRAFRTSIIFTTVWTKPIYIDLPSFVFILPSCRPASLDLLLQWPAMPEATYAFVIWSCFSGKRRKQNEDSRMLNLPAVNPMPACTCHHDRLALLVLSCLRDKHLSALIS